MIKSKKGTLIVNNFIANQIKLRIINAYRNIILYIKSFGDFSKALETVMDSLIYKLIFYNVK